MPRPVDSSDLDRLGGEVTGEFAKVDRRLLYLQVRVIGTSDSS
jgi:hypothetical protein